MSRLFIIIPAAGHSRRMGASKLLLELGGRPVIVHLLESLLASSAVTQVAIVVRRDDQNLQELLAGLDEDRLRVIVPERDPEQMRQSVEVALTNLQATQQLQPEDAWALIPADHPLLSSGTFDRLVRRWQTCEKSILVPTVKGAGGHPTFFRWPLADEVSNLSADLGLNTLVQTEPRPRRTVRN